MRPDLEPTKNVRSNSEGRFIAMSRRVARIIVTGAAAVAAVGLAATSASADPFEPSSWTIDPGGPYTATTGFTELADVTVGVSFTCTTDADGAASTATGDLKIGPGVTNPLGDVKTLNFHNCSGPLGAVTATPNDLPYDINGYTFDDMATVNETVGYIGPVNVHVSMDNCAFDVVGNAPGFFDNATSELRVDPAAQLPAGVEPLHPININCLGLVNETDVLTYDGDYTVSPHTTITGQV
ncbi:MAG: hypothetical protein GEV28_30725 [Actinophytocola sp.]|uniref:hypothetical protein n=1 Tax=Actinophytocola sp. TaxID=1872138 RepID=UPI00132B0FE4|nr:hypothetical protein [Actinophytocola sp.]MPZ84527.1 hypothetical protein [Actinophytocola sp.]